MLFVNIQCPTMYACSSQILSSAHLILTNLIHCPIIRISTVWRSKPQYYSGMILNISIIIILIIKIFVSALWRRDTVLDTYVHVRRPNNTAHARKHMYGNSM